MSPFYRLRRHFCPGIPQICINEEAVKCTRILYLWLELGKVFPRRYFHFGPDVEDTTPRLRRLWSDERLTRNREISSLNLMIGGIDTILSIIIQRYLCMHNWPYTSCRKDLTVHVTIQYCRAHNRNRHGIMKVAPQLYLI